MENKFWLKKKLRNFTQEEWELICDRCAKCCVHKFLDEDDQLIYTRVACRLLDLNSLTCRDYQQRVEGCKCLDKSDIKEKFYWLPKTCSYRLLAEGQPLPDWHHLITGDYSTVHTSGNSLKGKMIPEAIAGDDFLDYAVDEF